MAWKHVLGKPVFGLGVLLILGSVIGGLIFRQIHASEEASRWVMHTQIVLRNVADLEQEVSRAESAQRGFVASGNADFIAAYQEQFGHDATSGKVDETLTTLRDLISDNHPQQALLAKLAALVAEKRRFMDETIRLATKSLPQAQQKIATGEGKYLMDDMLAGIRTFRNNEQQLLSERNQRAAAITRLNTRLTMGLLALLIAVMASALLTIRKEFNRRLQVEKELRRVSEFQRTILDTSQYAIIACEVDGTIRMFNPAAEKLLGYRADELVGKYTPALFHDQNEIIHRAAELSAQWGTHVAAGFDVFAHNLIRGMSEEREWTYICKDGTRLSVMLSTSALREANGHIEGYLGLCKDITLQKQIETMKNEFISTVSHELRTPLTSIRGALGLISGTMAAELRDDARQLIAIAHKNTERLVRLINNILDIEKIESGNLVFENRPLDCTHVARHAIDEMRGLAEKANVTLAFESRAEEAQVNADEDRLVQVLGNLISNAIKYSSPGGTVTLRTEKMDGAIRFAVHDTGPGISESFQSRIFQKFAQADSSDSRQKEGSGLGLSISKAIIESMGGSLTFESAPGNTYFYATLPETSARPDAISDSGEFALPSRILICEDDVDIATLLRLSIEKEGFLCDVAYTAAHAKALLAENSFTAMTLDLSLPDQDGLTLINDLRAIESTRSLPIIVISARAHEGETHLNGKALGITGWLCKPIDLDHLKRLLAGIQSARRIPDILYVEDEPDIIQLIAVALEGIATIQPAHTLAEARALLAVRHFDLAILDLLLPDGDGIELLTDLSERARAIPVIILSVRETAQEIQKRVAASLVKSVVPEHKIIETIISLARRITP